MVLDLERSGRRLISTIKMQRSRHILVSFDGARRRSGLGAAAWILRLRDEYGSFEKVSYGGRVLRNASAMTAEREALRMGIEHLTALFPTEVSSFDFQVECTDRTVQYKLNAQSLRLFGLHSDVNDAHRAGANRLQNKNKQHSLVTSHNPTWRPSSAVVSNVFAKQTELVSASGAGMVSGARWKEQLRKKPTRCSTTSEGPDQSGTDRAATPSDVHPCSNTERLAVCKRGLPPPPSLPSSSHHHHQASRFKVDQHQCG